MPEVSNNNPCPFLRALVHNGDLPDSGAALGTIADLVAKADRGAAPADRKFRRMTWLVALLANGLSPAQIFANRKHGVRIDQLRNGPLDKKGAGSGLLDRAAHVNPDELARLEDFATDKRDLDGKRESGFGIEELNKYMDANFNRAKGRRRAIDRLLMKGEWPVLLRIMGKEGQAGRYLSLSETKTLFLDRSLPDRVRRRLDVKIRPSNE